MGHVGFRTEKIESRTPKAWLPVAAQVTTLVNKVTEMYSISVSIGPKAAIEAGTAFWSPTTSDIEINTNTMLPGVKPASVDLGDKIWCKRHAPFMGGIYHEAGHAAYSRSTPADLAKTMVISTDPETGAEVRTRRFTDREIDVLTMLEESRVERWMVKSHPTSKRYLRRMATEIVNADFRVADTRYGASVGAALTLARVDAGSVSKAAGKLFQDAIGEVLDAYTLRELRKVWLAYQALDLHVVHNAATEARMQELAARWIELVVDPEEEGADDLAQPGQDGEPGDEGDGDGESGKGGKGGKLAEKLAETGREEATEADSDLADEIREDMAERKRADKAADAERAEKGKAASKKAKDKLIPVTAHGFGEGGDSDVYEVRGPESDERSAATRLAAELSKITTHDKVVTRIESALPPGRVRGKAAVTGAAQLAGGQMVTARPFTATRRKVVETDHLAIGVISDVSGSMAGAMVPLAVMNYVLANGADKVDAKYFSAIFGNTVRTMVEPGQRVDKVVKVGATSGTERIRGALDAADYELGLIDGTGARVLVILSDGHLVDGDHANYCRTWLRLAKRAGVTVVWAHWDRDGSSFGGNHGYGEIVNMFGKSAAEAAGEIGKVIVAAVKAAQAAVVS